MIEAFGNFVVGGNYIIGVVIFLVLIAIQYVVINHGAVRISEVTARFTLDAMPGKQMSIDSDLNAGLIDEAEARQPPQEAGRRSRVLRRDGRRIPLHAARCRREHPDHGINIVAGFLIGVFQHGMDLKQALETYTVLTIGDGLVTVIPALMIPISGGLIVTRASSETRLGTDVRKQVFSNPQPLLLAGGGADRAGRISGPAQDSVSRAGRRRWVCAAGDCGRKMRPPAERPLADASSAGAPRRISNRC